MRAAHALDGAVTDVLEESGLEHVVQNPASVPALPPVTGFRDLLRDPAVRYGVKFGLAGMAAVYISLLIRLDNPGWALFTVFVLMVAQYVGAIAEKSLYRFVGTVVGGVAGYLMTGSLEQNPVLFLVLTGLFVGACTALFGQSRYPYAFFLCGMTTLVVASNGMSDPATSWRFMTWRIQEIFVGIVVTLVVQSVIWPRYARRDFLEGLRAAFGDLRACFLDSSGIRRDGERPQGERRAQDFPARITGLRTLLEFGSRESRYFRRKLHVYYELTGTLGRIAYAIGTLRERIPVDSLYQKHAGKEAEAVHAAIAGALADLEAAEGSSASRSEARDAMDSAFENLENAFRDMRSEHLVRRIPAEQAMVLGLHVLALDEIRTQIVCAHGLLDSLAESPVETEKSPVPSMPPWPPPFWIKTGVKSGLALAVAFLIDNWLHPPGGPMFVLGTWVFTALNAASPGGQGDRRAFHLIPLNVVALVGISLILIAARPMLSSYAVMNTIIFSFLFVWGYASFTTRGMTIPMQLAMLVVVGILGLNGQHPVSFQAIADFFFGLALALVVSALFQRLLWPSLPQWEIRDRFIDVIGICRRLIARRPPPLWIKTRLALIPGEVGVRLAHLNPPICPEGEPERLAGLMSVLVRIGGNLMVSLDRIEIPESWAAAGRELISQLEERLDACLLSIQEGFRELPHPPSDEAGVRSAVQALREWMAATRLEMIAGGCPPLQSARMAGFVERYTLMAEDVLDAGQRLSGLRLGLYMGDYSL